MKNKITDKITVVMPCYVFNNEGLQLTKDAVTSLGDVNLIIVDDASPVGGGFLRSVANTYIRNNKQSGFGKSVNKGLKQAGEELIAIVNNDIRVSPNWQDAVRKVFELNNDIFSVHLRMTDYDVPFKFGHEAWLDGKERWCQASFFVIDGNKKQLFHEGFLHSYDDWEYFFRARQQWKTAYTNLACFQHNHSFTRRQLPDVPDKENKDREHFKEMYGDYAETLFAKRFPSQMAEDWKSGFDEGVSS